MPLLAKGQPISCDFDDADPNNTIATPAYNPSIHCTPTVSYDNYDLISPFTVYVNFHFDANWNVQEGKDLVERMVRWVNDQYLDNLRPCELAGPNGNLPEFFPEAKWSMKIYTDPTNANDIHGGIWFEQQQTNTTPYSNRVVDIWLRDNNDCGNGNADLCGGDINVDGFGVNTPCLTPGDDNDFAVQVRSLNHELGHNLGLRHTSFCMNECRLVDIDPDAECNANCPSQQTCASANPSDIFCSATGQTVAVCSWGDGNNLMSQGERLLCITPCQWERAYNCVVGQNNYPTYSWADGCTESAPDHHITSGITTWNNLMLLNRNIIVDPGATLEINCEVRFSKDKRIIVEPGGKLIVDDARITNLCPDKDWAGIMVKGTPTASQFDLSQQGFVWMKDAIIEHAFIATSSVGGGIVQAYDTEFINNYRSAVITNYAYNSAGSEIVNFGGFWGCTFTLDDDYLFTGNTNYYGAQVNLVNLSPVRFSGCNFNDNRTIGGQGGAFVASKGILAYNAGLSTIDCNFYEQLIGIDIQEPGAVRMASVQGGLFDNCFRGINAISKEGGAYTGIEFNIGGYSRDIPSGMFVDANHHAGIFMEYCTGYQVQDNDFNGVAGADPIGTCIQNSNLVTPGSSAAHSDYNEIRQNTFDDLTYANVANGLNTGGLIGQGLTYICSNQSNSVEHDILVVLGTVKQQQNDLVNNTERSAGNIFSNCPSEDNKHIDNVLAYNNMDYFYWNGAVDQEPYCSPSTVVLSNAPKNECTEELEPTEDPTTRRQRFDTLSAQYLLLYESYRNKLDNGDKNAVLLLINTATIANRANRINTLVSYAPYLSEESLLTLLNNTVFTNTQKATVLAAHPEVLRNRPMWQAIENHTSFSPSEVSILETAREQNSVRGTEEQTLSQVHTELHYTGNQLLRESLRKDTLVWADVRHYLDGKQSLSAAYSLAESYLQEGGVTAANNYLDALELAYSFTGVAATEHDYFINLKRLEAQLLADGKGWNKLDTTQLTTLTNIAQQSTQLAGRQAQLILMMREESTLYYREPAISSGGNQAQSGNIGQTIPEARTISAPIKVFPNPAKEEVYFRYRLVENHPAYIHIYNGNGQLAEKLLLETQEGQVKWNKGRRAAGLYFFQLYVKDELTTSGRFSIVD